MKNILKKLFIVLIVISIAFGFNYISKAENEIIEEETDSITDLEDNFEEDEIESEDYEEDETEYEDENEEDDYSSDYAYEKNYFYAGSDAVTLDKPVEGDVFIFTSGKVVIDSEIYGNTFICATDVEITENAQIYSSLFDASKKLKLSGNVAGNSYVASQEFTLDESAVLNLDLFLTSEVASISGVVDRDINVGCENISFSDSALIGGNLNYSSDSEAIIPEGIVDGSVNYLATNKEVTVESNFSVSSFIYSVISFAILGIVIFLVAKWKNCKQITEAKDFTQNIGKYILYGLVGIVVVPVAFVMLLICGVTVNLAFILLALYIMLILISSACSIVSISYIFLNKFSDKLDTNNTAFKILAIVALSVIYKALKLIPVLGTLISLAINLIGFGILTKLLTTKSNTVEEK